MKYINREDYINKLINVIGIPDIKVITGVRRSGKSKLLLDLKNYITTNIKDSNIIHINYNLSEYDNIREYKKLVEYVESKYNAEKQNFILIDEVQMCKGFENAINNFHAEEKYDIYITGSNAFLMSSDLATLFTGRTFKIEVYPFSFKEYIKYFGMQNIEEAFANYVLDGGMAGAYLYKTEKERADYVKDVYNTLIIRDIKQKYRIRHTSVIQSLSNYLMDNISNLTSSNNIANVLNSNNIKITDKTINKYIEYLCNAYAFYEIKRYDIKGKKYLNAGAKYYLSDIAFRAAILGKKNMDYGRLYENIIAIELLRRGYDVYVGSLYNKEIDFVAERRDERIYIQVSDNISDPLTFKREVTPLLQIRDAYPKILIANTKHDMYLYEGIQVYDIAKWLHE